MEWSSMFAEVAGSASERITAAIRLKGAAAPVFAALALAGAGLAASQLVGRSSKEPLAPPRLDGCVQSAVAETQTDPAPRSTP